MNESYGFHVLVDSTENGEFNFKVDKTSDEPDRYLVKSYLDDCNARLSPRTVSNYKQSLLMFKNHLNGRKLQDATLHDVRLFLNDMKIRNCTRGTISARLVALKTFYDFISTYHGETVPDLYLIRIKDYPLARWERKGQNALPKNEIRALIEAPNNLRDVLILALTYYTGMRAKEIATCKLDNISLIERKILIVGKGDKPRTLPYPKIFDRLLYYWINVVRQSYVHAIEGYLFPSKHGAHLSPVTIYNIVCRNAKKAGIQEILGLRPNGRRILKVHTHILRHSYARHSIDDNIPLINVQHMMGHSSINTTIHYTGRKGLYKPYYDQFTGI